MTGLRPLKPHTPTLTKTRYSRRLVVLPPFDLIFGPDINARSGAYVSELIPRGFAVLTIDVR